MHECDMTDLEISSATYIKDKRYVIFSERFMLWMVSSWVMCQKCTVFGKEKIKMLMLTRYLNPISVPPDTELNTLHSTHTLLLPGQM